MPIPWEISTYLYGCNNINTTNINTIWFWYWYWYQHNPKEALFAETVDIPLSLIKGFWGRTIRIY